LRAKARLEPGTEIEVVMDDISVRLIRHVPGPELVREDDRWVVKPTVDPEDLPPVDLAAMVDEERNRWPW